MKILAFDPGGTTGICGFHSEHGITMQDEIAEPSHHIMLYTLLDLIKPDLIIYELFEVHGGRASVDLIARDYCGVLDLWAQQNGDTPVVTHRTHFMNFWTDEKLKMTGLYQPGHPHANDATRHMLYYISFTLGNLEYIRMCRKGDE